MMKLAGHRKGGTDVVNSRTTTNATGSGITAPLFRACGRGGNADTADSKSAASSKVRVGSRPAARTIILFLLKKVLSTL